LTEQAPDRKAHPEVALRAIDLGKTYPGFALKKVSLEVRRGEVLAVIGPSGAGKSTLLGLLAGLIKPDEGQIERQAFAVYLDQTPYVLERSVLENAILGLSLKGVRRAAARAVARRWLDRVGLDALADQPAKTLSGGERVRLAFARALATSPEALLLDEPTANLDPANVNRIELLIQEARDEGLAIVLVTHNLFQARRLADRALFLLEGRVVEEGPAPSFFDRPKDPRTRAFLSGEMVW